MRSIAVLSFSILAVIAATPPGFADGKGNAKLESQGGGLQTATFDTFSGTVTVNLPEDIAAGDTFSGTVVAEPSGDSDKKKEKNRGALVGYIFELGEHARGKVGDGRLTLDVPETPAPATLILREVRKGQPGREVGRVEIPVRDTAAPVPEFRLPTIVQQNTPLLVGGPFDGDLESTALQIGGFDARPLAESPRAAVFRSPHEVSGVTQITLRERGELAAEGQVRNIATNLSAPKPNLKAGESTTLTTLVTGLEDLDEEIPLRLRFWPQAIISVEGGYDHVKTIRPEEVRPDGTYSFGVRITGRMVGQWNASVRVKTPEPSVVDRYMLVLDGALVGEIENVRGVGPSASAREAVSFDAGLGLSKSFVEWIQKSVAEGPQQRDGRIVGVDAGGKSREVTDFRRASINSIRFPTFDVDDHSPAMMTIEIDPEALRYEKGTGERVDTGAPRTKNWLCSSFRFELGDLPLERVNKVDSFTWEQNVVGEESDFKLNVSSSDPSAWERWHRGFYIIDRTVPVASDARLVFLDRDRSAELATLEFHDATYSSLEIRQAAASSSESHEVRVEVTPARMTLDR